MLENILSKSLRFIYAGENERPVRAVNFRGKELGGLGLINPVIKAKAFLIKSMYNEYTRSGGDWENLGEVRKLYGYPEDLIKLIKDKSSLRSPKLTYYILMENNCTYFKHHNIIHNSKSESLGSSS